MTPDLPPRSLVADIGGTNTRVALARGAEIDTDSIRRFRNAEHDGIGAVITRFLEAACLDESQIGGVCVAAAGPVRDGAVQMTNLDWRVDRDSLASALTAESSAVLNDLQAQGHAIGHVAPGDLIDVLLPENPASDDGKLVVGVGTGFNACAVHEAQDGRRIVPASEAGHVSLPATVPGLEAALPAITARHGFASVEEVLSGRGLGTLHAALHGSEADAAAIMSSLEDGDPAARQTGRLFVQVLGAVVGDLALTHLPFGGIYLVGGVARAFGPWLETFGFAEAFREKGRFTSFQKRFAVRIVTDDYAALTGCAAYLAREADAAART